VICRLFFLGQENALFCWVLWVCSGRCGDVVCDRFGAGVWLTLFGKIGAIAETFLKRIGHN
jgi:hypothetical protein